MDFKGYRDFENINGYIKYLESKEVLTNTDFNGIDYAITSLEMHDAVNGTDSSREIEELRTLQEWCLQ